MALVRVNLIGDGTEKNPYRANLPAYSERHSNVTQGYIIAYVPDVDFHEPVDKLDAKIEETTEGPMIVGLSDEHHAKWHAHLDERYAEHKGEYRPNVK